MLTSNYTTPPSTHPPTHRRTHTPSLPPTFICGCFAYASTDSQKVNYSGSNLNRDKCDLQLDTCDINRDKCDLKRDKCDVKCGKCDGSAQSVRLSLGTTCNNAKVITLRSCSTFPSHALRPPLLYHSVNNNSRWSYFVWPMLLWS